MPAPFLQAGRAPAAGQHRGADVGRVRVRHGRDDLLGDRALVVVVPAAGRGHWPAPDEQGPVAVEDLGQARRLAHVKNTFSEVG
jgi:hypothetical protein